MSARRGAPIAAALIGLSALAVGLGGPGARADGSHLSIDWVAADPASYDHSTGAGGTYGDVVESLEGGDFICGDIVVFFAAISVDPSETDEHTVELDLGFFAQPTGSDGVGFVDIVSASANAGDPAHDTDGDESVSILTQSGGHPGDTVQATIQITNLGVDDNQFILRIESNLGCTPDTNPTGNLGAGIADARVTSPEPDAINAGQQSIPFQSVGDISPPPTTTTTTTTTTEPTTTTSTTTTTEPTTTTTSTTTTTTTSTTTATTTTTTSEPTSSTSTSTTTTEPPTSTTTVDSTTTTAPSPPPPPPPLTTTTTTTSTTTTSTTSSLPPPPPPPPTTTTTTSPSTTTDPDMTTTTITTTTTPSPTTSVAAGGGSSATTTTNPDDLPVTGPDGQLPIAALFVLSLGIVLTVLARRSAPSS